MEDRLKRLENRLILPFSLDRPKKRFYIAVMKTERYNEFAGSPIVIGIYHTMYRTVNWKKHIFDRPGALLTIRNSGKIAYRDNEQELRPGDLAIYDALPRHEFSGGNDWTYYWFHVPPEMLEEYRDTPYNTSVPGVRLASFEKLQLARIKVELQEAQSLFLLRPSHWEKLSALLMQVVIARGFKSITTGSISEKTPLDGALKLLEEDGGSRTVAGIASSCGMSRATFFRKFQAQYGCSPLEYRDNRIIAQAKVLLCSTSLQIKEIAFQLNFHDSYYFSKFFHSKTGLPPSEYRRRNHIVR